MLKLKMTKPAVAKLKPPEKGTDIYQDTIQPRLFLRVGKISKVYYCVPKFGGKKIWLKVCDATLFSPDHARNQCLILLGKVAAGINPKESEQTQEAPTLRNALKQMLTLRDLKPSTVRSYKEALARLDDWMDLPINTITDDMVVRKLEQLKARGLAPSTQRGTFIHAKSVFNFAINRYHDADNQPLLSHNPVTALARLEVMPRYEPRRSRLFSGELPAFLDCLDKIEPLHPVMVDLVRLWLLTGMRKNEARLLKKDDIDLETHRLHVGDTKNRLDLDLPITDHMREILERRMDATDGDYLFPSLHRSDSVVAGARPVQKLVKKETGLAFTPHDLRRTFISVGASMGLRDVAKMVANHKLPSDDITAQYMNWDLDELRGLLTQIQTRILRPSSVDDRKSDAPDPEPAVPSIH